MDFAQVTVSQSDQLPSHLEFQPSSSEASSNSSSSGFCRSPSPTLRSESDNTTSWPSSLPTWTTDLDHCCNLLNNIWTYSPQASQIDTDVKSNTNQARTNSNSFFSGFSGSQTNHKARTVVTVDVERIRSDDKPHHPFDREFGSPSAASGTLFMRKPYGIAVNSKTEQIYVADRENNTVLIVGPDGSFQSQLGGLGSQPGRFYRPTALAFDAETDRLYVTDKDNHRVQVFNTTTGLFLFRFGSEGSNAGQFSYPWGIAILNKEGSSLVAVADSRNTRVQFFTKEGVYMDHFDAFSSIEEDHNSTTTGRKYPAKHQPRGLAFDPSGDVLYISDFNHHCIFKLDLIGRTFGKLLTQYNRSFNRPCGLDVDSDGNLFICDHRNQSLRKFRKDGTEVEGFLTGISFEMPTDVSLYPGLPGYLAVIDLIGRVRVLNYSN